MIDSNDLIHQSDTSQQALFSAKIENMSIHNPEGLSNLASQFGLDPNSDWRQIRDGLSDNSWREVTMAMERESGNADYTRL